MLCHVVATLCTCSNTLNRSQSQPVSCLFIEAKRHSRGPQLQAKAEDTAAAAAEDAAEPAVSHSSGRERGRGSKHAKDKESKASKEKKHRRSRKKASKSHKHKKAHGTRHTAVSGCVMKPLYCLSSQFTLLELCVKPP